MSIYNKYPRGSEWRKWDLHVHTPKSIEQNYGGDTEEIWEKFISDIESLPKEFKVIGINDYIFLDGYKTVLKYKKSGRLKNIDLILPVIELRIDKFGSIGDEAWKRVNFHIIFSDAIKAEIIEQQFLNAIFHTHKLSPEYENLNFSGVITRDSLIDFGQKIINSSNGKVNGSPLKIGFNNITFGYQKVKDILEQSTYFKDMYLTAVGKTEWDALRWNSSIADKKTIINDANLVFISSNSPQSFYKAKERLKQENVNSNLIDCSDAHTFSDSKDSKGNLINNRIGKCFTWIKADPTFEGLKQIIYEPKERVRIQENNPNEDFPKQVFSEIKIQETKIFGDGNVKFKQQNIPLNSNLVTIIGGRGTGKSLLLDCISKVFNKYNKRAENILIQNDDFIIEFTKFDGTKEDYKIQEDNELDYLHIHQGYVKEIVDPKETNKLDSEIKSLLNIKEIDFSKDESKIIHLIDEIFEIKNFLLKKDEEGNKVNSKQYIEKQIEKKLQLIKNITTNQNQELIKQYTENLKNINLYLHKKEDLYKFKDELNSFQNNKNLIINKINGTIEIEENKIPLISFTKQIEKIEDLIKTYEVKIDKFNNINENIKKTFVEQGIKGDITTLLEQTKNYQDEIDKLTEKLKEVEKKENSLNEKFKNIEELISSIEEDYSNYKDEVINKWQNLKNGKEDWSANQKDLIKKLLEDIEIEAEEVFEIDKFYELLIESGILNMMKFRAIKDKSSTNRIKEFFNITNKDDYKKFLKNELATQGQQFLFKDLIDSDFFNKEGAREFLKLLILDFHKYWKVITKPKYKSKELYQLSVGMKGTMFLCIKLATDPFMKPFIFDQPEDDLDNDFIVNELVPIFKEIKKYRQVIIATHNANLVVNADAEQVIIANNNNEELSYISGSIENPSIREHICNILEGGQEAFESRKNKYNFK